MINKKGSHLGTILSMVLFIGFLIFLYVIAAPLLRTQQDFNPLLDSLEVKLLNQFYANLTTVTATTLVAPIGNCMEITHPPDNIGDNFIAKDINGDLINTFDTGSSLQLEWPQTNNFYKIYYSPETFNLNSFIPLDCGEGEIKAIKMNEKVFVNKINDFIDIYNEDYEDAKSLINFTATNDFGFNFTDVNGNMIGTNEKDITRNVFVKEIQILYVDSNAGVAPGILAVRVW